MATTHYELRIAKVIDYIEDHLTEKLSLEMLSDVAMLSKYHFHRVFKSIVGETLNSYIKRIKMTKALRCLRSKTPYSIQDIAFELGYNSTSNFTRDFGVYFGHPPSAADQINISNSKASEDQSNFQLKFNVEFIGLAQIRSRQILYKKITTGYNTETIKAAFDDLYHLALSKHFKIDQFIGIGYDDPDYTPISKCRYDACIAVDSGLNPKSFGINNKILEGGHFAIFRFNGAGQDISLAWDYIFKDWLINSSYLPDDRTHLEMYLPSEKHAEGIFEVNLCLPVIN